MTTVSFQVKYRALHWEQINVCGDIAELGSWKKSTGLMLHWSEGDIWTGQLELPSGVSRFEYKYVVFVSQTNDIVMYEGGSNRVIEVDGFNTKIIDEWQGNKESLYLTSFFDDVIFSHTSEETKSLNKEVKKNCEIDDNDVSITVLAYSNIRRGQSLYLSGDHSSLGGWQLKNAVKCTFKDDVGKFQAQFNIKKGERFEYKFVIRNSMVLLYGNILKIEYLKSLRTLKKPDMSLQLLRE